MPGSPEQDALVKLLKVPILEDTWTDEATIQIRDSVMHRKSEAAPRFFFAELRTRDTMLPTCIVSLDDDSEIQDDPQPKCCRQDDPWPECWPSIQRAGCLGREN
ncbi:hypothetical protein E2562_017109 [Oryza meyeriana var. granulata]|uniref:Uncharacterized protein n=1 Tax=Oryza meyeriana var. granulata TaxID=110450 RepID=A0A6G1DYL5_9ORYZ|nr:hypothetical protein E2562_017109 [Oryza meyeriana var. granulata]